MRVFAADDDPSEDDMIAQIIHHILSHFINAVMLFLMELIYFLEK
jgi:hypothetical protein